MNNMLSAIKRGDKKKLDALMKQTEFVDYAQYFVSTYSDDSLAAEDWAIAYKRWLGENEDHLRELLETLAKDEGGKILVRKANDDPARGKGFEWGIVHYARRPVDIYCVTLVFSPSPDGPSESTGYYVYADSTFRWDSIVPFAAPGTYQSAPDTLNASQTVLAHYPNTPDGLRDFLSELREAGKSGNHEKVDSMIKQTEIPEYRNWFCSVYIPGSGLSWAIPYGKNLAQNEQSFTALWQKLALDDGEITVRKLVDKPGGNRDMEWGMIHNSRTPLDIYHAEWKSKTGAPNEQIGYFTYIDGMFRLNSTERRVAVARPAQDSREPVYRVGGAIKAPQVISSPQPNYPREARKGHAAGPIVVGLIVGSDGRVRYVKVERGISPELDQAAVDAVEMWKFHPATKEGKPVSVQITEEFDFQP